MRIFFLFLVRLAAEDTFITLLQQTFEITISMMKARYRKTVAGFIWVLLNPIIMFGAQSLAFKKFLKLSIPNYHLFLTSNLIPWIFLITNLQMCTSIFEEKRMIIKSFKVNPLVFLFAQIFDNFFNFTCTFLLLLLPLLWGSGLNTTGILHLIIALPLLFVISGIISSLSAFLQVFYKDVRFVVQFLTSVIFFVTPVFYPIEYVPIEYRSLIELNIFYIAIKPINICLYNFDMQIFWLAIGKLVVVISGLLLVSYYTWRSKRNEFYLYL